ncbi:MAG: forkhead-associated protein [Chloroflexi bacterium]|nr:MAG: forkhead-associated protein [Chloroflexota bacterium]
MKTKQHVIAILVLAMSLIISSCVPWRLFGSTVTPIPTQTPLPTSTLTPVPPTPTSTTTPVLPSPAPEQTTAPAVQTSPTSTQQTAPQKPPVEITVYCAEFGLSPSYAEVDQPIVLKWAWGATTEAYRQDYISAASFSVQIDGQFADVSSAWLTLSYESGQYVARWRLPPRILSVGTHQLISAVTLSRQITDGLDSNGDGNLDTFGPGTTTHPCEIIVR